jgi:hypothetical protein
MEMVANKNTILLVCLLLLSRVLCAQTERFQIERKNTPLSEVLKEIEGKTNMMMVYGDDIINGEQKVNLSGDYSLSEALNLLLKGTGVKVRYAKDKVIIYRTREKKNKHVLSGYIREKESRELLPLANVYLPEYAVGTSSNSYGFYSITLPEDSVTIVFSYAGYTTEKIRLKMTQDQVINIELTPNVLLKEVVVVSTAENEAEVIDIGHINIPVDQMKNVSFILGEKDIFKAIQLLPGVKRGTEGSSGFYVRGGGPDQNLILLDDAPVYNANHLFGFFSSFNGNAIKSIDFYKGGFPSRYGGRLSSILDMRMKEGNQNEVHGEASIGLISSNLTLEGPIKKDKISAMISVRRTYFDVLTKPFLKPGQLGYYFYDFNAKISFNINERNKVYLSSYSGKDNLESSTNNEGNSTKSSLLNWANQTSTLRWNHQFSNKVFGNASAIYSNFNLNSASNQVYQDTTYFSRYFSAIRDWNIKYDLDVFASSHHHIRSGFNLIAHRFNPGALVVKEQVNLNFKDLNSPIDVYEAAIYAEDEWKATQELAFNFGMRLTGFNQSLSSLKLNPEPRITSTYQFLGNWAIKASYTKMYQYIHLLSNTGVGLPTDLWVPSTEKVPYQSSTQGALGITHNLPNKRISISVEVYSKESNDVVSYKPGSTFLAIDRPTSEQYLSWEDKVTSGKSWSEGIEILIQKKIGRLNGWIGYTLSKTELQFNDINFGKKFFALHDRRHDLSVVAIYNLNERITFSSTWIYQSGNRITAPQNSYVAINHDLFRLQAGSYNEVTDYGSQNSFETPAYHRLDVGVQFHKKKKRYERIFEVGLYNAYYRKNPFLYQVVTDSQRTYLQGINVFPIIPSFSYQIKF